MDLWMAAKMVILTVAWLVYLKEKLTAVRKEFYSVARKDGQTVCSKVYPTVDWLVDTKASL